MPQQRNDMLQSAGQKAAGAAGAGAVAGGEVWAAPVVIKAAQHAAGRGAGAPLIAAGAANAAGGPAAIVAIPAGMAGEYVGGAIADQLDLDKDGNARVAVKAGGGGAAAVGGGAGVGLVIAGPPGAAAGAVVAGIGYGAGKAVEGAMWVGRGADGTARVHNSSSKWICVCSYNQQNHTQIMAYSSIILQPGQFEDITAHRGGFTFGAKCDWFHLHVYEGNANSQRELKTKGYGIKVYPGKSYDWNGSVLS